MKRQLKTHDMKREEAGPGTNDDSQRSISHTNISHSLSIICCHLVIALYCCVHIYKRDQKQKALEDCSVANNGARSMEPPRFHT